MNAEQDPFESLLRQQPVRQLPAHWRDSILPKATPSATPWPGPRAWQMLAACWIVIIALHFLASPPASPSMAPARVHETPRYDHQDYALALAVISQNRSQP